MGVGCELEHRTKDGMFMLDIGIPDGLGSGSVAEGSAAFGSPIAVEVDGPRHFTCSRPYRELGPTVLRRNLLQVLLLSAVGLPPRRSSTAISPICVVAFMYVSSPAPCIRTSWHCSALVLILQARGWVVVNLPLHEWKPLEGNLERQRDWVADKFAAQGLVIGGGPR